MPRLYLLMLVILVVAVMLFSCKAQENAQRPVGTSPALEDKGAKPADKPALSGWELQWEKVTGAAKNEARVAIYTGIGSELRTDLTRAIKSRYKDIDVEFTVGRGPEITQKVLSEQRAGLFIADLYISGATNPIAQLKPSGALVPMEPFLILPEVLDPKVWFEGVLPFIDRDKIVLAFMARPNPPLTINTTMVKENEIKGYKELLDLKWKGKIVIDDPTQGGPGLKWFGVVGTRILNMDYMRQFARQEPVVMRDARLAVEWVAHGKYPLGVSLQSPIVTEFQKAGAPLIQISPVEGDYITSGFGTVSVVKGAPHKNAAILFLNWLLSREGLLVWSKSELRQSARVDIPIDFLDKIHVRQPGIRYVSGDDEELLLEQLKQAELAREIFRPLLGR